MQLYTVWKKDGTGINEKCLMNTDGDYIGIETSKKYSSTNHYHSKQYKAQIVAVDNKNKTGMYHLYKELNDNDEENSKSWKSKYIGCCVTVEKAHWYGDIQVYRCLELNEYFSSNEIKIIE